jgi:YD repeat-containing protein
MTTYNGGNSFYSANGELQKKIDAQGTTLYNYDVLGNLRSVSLPDGRLIEYVIDASNRRVGKKVNGTLTTGWIYGDQLRIIAETDGTGAVTRRRHGGPPRTHCGSVGEVLISVNTSTAIRSI